MITKTCIAELAAVVVDDKLIERATLDLVAGLLDLIRPMPAADAIKLIGTMTAQIDKLRRQLEKVNQ